MRSTIRASIQCGHGTDKLSFRLAKGINEKEFKALVDVIDRHEGDRIRLVGRAADLVVEMLINEPDRPLTFALERVDDATIQSLPRCSPLLIDLLAPIGELSRL